VLGNPVAPSIRFTAVMFTTAERSPKSARRSDLSSRNHASPRVPYDTEMPTFVRRVEGRTPSVVSGLGITSDVLACCVYRGLFMSEKFSADWWKKFRASPSYQEANSPRVRSQLVAHTARSIRGASLMAALNSGRTDPTRIIDNRSALRGSGPAGQQTG
jgi:hypothetical protein